MPIYKVPRLYNQVKHVEVTDEVYIEADSPEKAQERVSDGEYDDIADMGEETGHWHEYGEVIQIEKVGDAELAPFANVDHAISKAQRQRDQSVLSRPEKEYYSGVAHGLEKAKVIFKELLEQHGLV